MAHQLHLGNCHTPETARDALTPCSLSTEQYVCVVGDDIFDFSNKRETVDNNCISHGSQCLIYDHYITHETTASHDQCETDCVEDHDCFL